MKPKKFEKIRLWETKLKDAIFLKDKEKVAECMDALYRRGCSREDAIMEAARNFLRQSQVSGS